jgi:hypothetical protein
MCSARGGWTPAALALSTADLWATHALQPHGRDVLRFSPYDPGLRVELFDSLVRPIPLDGAEL